LADAEERTRSNRDVLGRVIHAQEAERARVARDLHDQIGQSLTSVLLGLRLVTDTLARSGTDLADARARVDDVRELVGDALQEVRELAFELRPTVLDDVGLVAAMRRLAADVARRQRLTIDVVLADLDEDSRFPSDLETVVYRVVQEALTNVARHAGATKVRVNVVQQPTALRALVHDDGIGFDMHDVPRNSPGLAGMQERAALAGGHLQITSQPGHGTTIALEVPLV
jgi:signal transduction histidine kinase